MRAFPTSSSFAVRSAVAGAVLAAWLVPASAGAITQPGTNIVIPTDNEVRDALAHLGESIEPTRDAAITPERFKPLCNLTFTVLVRLTDFKNSFGWYNVTGSVPALNELYEFIHCSDPPNTWDATYANQTSRTLDIRRDPRYLGGEIGFFQAVGQSGGCADVSAPASVRFVVYSEPALNPDSAAATQTIHLLTMNSGIQNNVFYFAWEDLLQGGDNDFSDLLLRVEGINCAGGGERCDTGLDGVCADGATRCENGELVCHPRQAPSDERCNGLDDDCDGMVDDGDLCAADQICDRGRCIDRCNTGEFRCGAPLFCRDDGYCVDPACAEVTCAPGRLCVAGECVDPCAGVTCPFERECRAGRCVDPCAGIECAEDQACRGGACITTCECSGCDAGATCDRSLKVCVEDACASVTCGPGTHCAGGDCVDGCLGAVCPNGQTCTAGECVGDVVGPGDVEPRGGGPSIPIGAGTGSGATPGAISGSGGAGEPGGSGAGAPDRDTAGSSCACRSAGGARSAAGLWLGAALAIARLARRARRARRAERV